MDNKTRDKRALAALATLLVLLVLPLKMAVFDRFGSRLDSIFQDSFTTAYLAIWLGAIAIAILIFIVVFKYRCSLKASRLSEHALPNNLPEASLPDDPSFSSGKCNYEGCVFSRWKPLGMRISVKDNRYTSVGRGKAWLANEVFAFQRHGNSRPIVIPYALIHDAFVHDNPIADFEVFVATRPRLHIVWGRPELPIETVIAVSGRQDTTTAWAQEIIRRASVWKERMAAAQADGAV